MYSTLAELAERERLSVCRLYLPSPLLAGLLSALAVSLPPPPGAAPLTTSMRGTIEYSISYFALCPLLYSPFLLAYIIYILAIKSRGY